ncbi:MAG TPA: aldehyde dehydrogenase family protein [Pyrinomonadaceae bacterium]|jgi:glyceraldehyde-3-phosphate dehydrogenase (NADP+)|nr:aldehyde dehydrogenase family protein [Pyrinomonadaceae bacterium]
MEQKPFLIGGEWRMGATLAELRAPFGGEILARFSVASRAEVEEAIAAASAAAVEMRGLPRFRVAEALHAIAAGLRERREEFARTIAVEACKPIKTAYVETDRAVSTFTFAAEEARRFTGEQIPLDTQASGAGRIGWTERIPRGVIFGITPFNFPLNLVAHKVAPALAARNAIIVKPSPRTPLTALLLGEVFLSSGLPAGALQVVPMEIGTIDAVLGDERVGMISFTGSAEVGWRLRERAARKMVTLELGGNAPVIVDETADVAYAVERTAAAAFSYAGQVCISAQRIIVHEEIAEDFTARLVESARNMKTGDPLDEATELSNMIDEAAARRAESWIREALQGGARLLCGGTRRGALLDATILADVHSEMRICAEEVFAPVATIQKFSDFADALDEANQTRYGLQAGVFTRDMRRALLAFRTLEVGGVMINDAPAFRVDNMPYGGVKQSGAGREGVRYAMEEMTEPRLIVIDPAR